MVIMTEMRLYSRKTETNHESVIGKKRKKKKRRRLGDDNEEKDDACTALYMAAQAHMKQKMKEVGLEGILPLSFGNKVMIKKMKKHKRSLEETSELILDEEKVDQVVIGEEIDGVDWKQVKVEGGEEVTAIEVEKEEVQINEEESLIPETTTVEKVRVVYDSDGGVAERVVENVEVGVMVESEKQSVDAIVYKKSRGKKKYKYPVAKDVVKFYVQRHILFEKFEDGIQLDHESWYSVTPQVVAEHIATRLSCDVVIDPFAGCGGNVIQLAMTCKQVIAIDIDPKKIRMAKHNAAIYGVAEKIEWIVGNSIDIMPRLKADAVFLSPPWGGVSYNRQHFSIEDMLVKGVSGLGLFAMARKVSKNIAYYLPRGTSTSDLEALTPGEPVECEKVFLNDHLKVLTAYYGDLVTPNFQAEESLVLVEDTGDT
ncbi:unnamed protein product [Peronospora farinosa]|uniref:Trimethylguanosine synthase n=1 Tax=Peronospora farinosa TaxID=134698 RepID=A0AAV0U352_9STRA|nr:unnamed protein product [Peronospora farinosa]CAI5729312.1 unnamed protein product [Peronospora farinosa]